MKLSAHWLQEWVEPGLTRDQLVEKLTMAGLTVEACVAVGEDYVYEFELTPNRGDCSSIAGVAREISALTNSPLTVPHFKEIPANTASTFSVEVQTPADCPRYVGRVIENISTEGTTPQWMQTRLSISGIKTISPVVDVMNYVMLELGQPLHAFDLRTLKDKIIVRRAHNNEQLTLLDEKKVVLTNDVLVIADSQQAHAIAGVMGGALSAVNASTTAIFIESAFFVPTAIAGRARRYGLHTEASYRFERGVDPELPLKAIHRATELLTLIYGVSSLQIGEVVEQVQPEYFPVSRVICLRHTHLKRLLGITVSEKEVTQIFHRLGMQVTVEQGQWLVQSPSYRFDIQEEIDLIEEVARLYGYHHIPAKTNNLPQKMVPSSEKQLSLSRLKSLLVHQGYHEVITYSFIQEKWQKKIQPMDASLVLSNPLSAEFAVMRSSLWPSLLEVLQHNSHRQQSDLRFFEVGLRFLLSKEKDLQQEMVLSGAWAGDAFPEQWGERQRQVDFYDIKNDIEQLLAMTGSSEAFTWCQGEHPMLHPGRAAKILKGDKLVGWCGELHPEIKTEADLNLPVYLFELSLLDILDINLPVFATFSKFPSVRRDIAFLIDTKITSEAVIEVLKQTAGKLLVKTWVFDLYQGKNIPAGKKSIALGLLFQALDRTLVEEEVTAMMTAILEQLKTQFSAALRE